MWSRKCPPEEEDAEEEAAVADPDLNLVDTSPFQERTLAWDVERRPWTAPPSTSTSTKSFPFSGEPEDPSNAPPPPDTDGS